MPADMPRKLMRATPQANTDDLRGTGFFGTKAGSEMIKAGGVKMATGVVPGNEIVQGFTVVKRGSTHHK